MNAPKKIQKVSSYQRSQQNIVLAPVLVLTVLMMRIRVCVCHALSSVRTGTVVANAWVAKESHGHVALLLRLRMCNSLDNIALGNFLEC